MRLIKKMTETMKKIGKVIKRVVEKFWGSILLFLVERGDVAVKVTDIVKKAVEDPTVNWVVLMTPTKKDDVLLAKAKILAPKLALQVGLAMGMVKAINESENEIQAAGKVFEYIRNFIPEEGHGIFYREFAGKVIEFSADGKISTAEAVALGQLAFKHIIKIG